MFLKFSEVYILKIVVRRSDIFNRYATDAYFSNLGSTLVQIFGHLI